ncbi:MSC_0624 family F1-like ATPase-associated membrane protein [Mesomycoplasma lagogenitalium]|uniref:Transmembrane protein n=1 Tax=Mesomycoplasma lagogenitalium TaxID=171286 RepID=A0ABY8LUW3_9BACT|nr:hypothetical protein [Mesomycoplasma lagogenitalium]WGI37027.1 hypothetical protein QEG99_01950 [Mesomycoplasma lagogenitalium]
MNLFFKKQVLFHKNVNFDVFKKQRVISFVLKWIVILFFFAYNLTTFLTIDSQYVHNANQSLFDNAKISFTIEYIIINSLSYYFLFKAYVNIQEQMLKIYYYLIWFVSFLLFSLFFYFFSNFYLTKENRQTEVKQLVLNVFWLWPYILFFLLVNLGFNIYLLTTSEQHNIKIKFKSKWSIISTVSKLLYFVLFFSIYFWIYKYTFIFNENIYTHPLINFFLFKWSFWITVAKILIILIFSWTLYPFIISFINFWEPGKKISDLYKMYLWISLTSLLSTILWFLIVLKDKFTYNQFNTFFIIFSAIVTIISIINSLFAKNIFASVQMKTIIMITSLFLIWIAFYLIRVIFDFKSSQNNDINLSITDVNLLVVDICSFIIIGLFLYKNPKISKMENTFIKIFITLVIIANSMVIYLKSNGLFWVVNELLNIEVIFFTIIIAIILLFLLISIVKQFMIIKYLKKGTQYVF